MPRVNKDDPAIQAVVQKAVAEALKAERRDRKQTLKDLKAGVGEKLAEIKTAFKDAGVHRSVVAEVTNISKATLELFKEAV